MFEIVSNDYWISYKLCRSVLEVQRSNFRPPIIFPATSGQMASHILRVQKSQNLPKNRFLAKNSNFNRVADMCRNDNIWPEMGPWNVLKSFCTPIWYFSAFRSIFMKFQKMQFLTFWIMGFGHFRAGRIFYGSKIGQISPGTNFYESSPFPKKMGQVRSGLSLTYSKICGYMPNPENCIFC